MTGRDEELALERLAVTDLLTRSRDAWAGGRYIEARSLLVEAERAQRHVEQLEAEGPQ